MLESLGFDVVEADGGKAGLEAIAELRPSLVLLDVQLPDISGFDVCAELERQGGATPDVVLVSSRDAADYGELVGASCACGFVAKGELSPETLTALLR